MEPLPSTSCPKCLTVRQSQGFDVIVNDSDPLCESCANWEANKRYLASEVYQTWLASIPQGLRVEEMIEWMKSTPPPPPKSLTE